MNTTKPNQYVLKPTEILMDSSGEYILKIRDLPQEDKPREKLLKHGPELLSTQELLAVVLGTGTKKEELSTMCHRIIKDYGERGILNEKDVTSLAQSLDIPTNKAAQIVACGELGQRFFHKNTMTNPVIRNAQDVFEYVKDMRHLPKEHLRGLYLNTRYKVIHDEVITIGTVDASIIHPREVLKPALEYSAVALILVHNHPSGDCDPSEHDIAVTQQIAEAGRLLGIPLIDHIIVSTDSFKRINI